MPKKALKLDDKHCLLWIKDPSVSPFENDNSFNYTNILTRKNILSEKDIKNPKSFLNRVKRKCFFNSALRQKIVERIKEYQKPNTPRLYTFSYPNEYTFPTFDIDECKKWVINHLVNPRTDEAITQDDRIYKELLYTAMQYDVNLVPSNVNENTSKLIENIKERLKFMKKIDEEFLNHNVQSFDKKLKIASSSPKREDIKAKKTFDISSSPASVKRLNKDERRQLRDMILEKKGEKRLVAEYQYEKGQQPKKDKDKTIFETFRVFLTELQKFVMDETSAIDNILKDSRLRDDKTNIRIAIFDYFRMKRIDDDAIFKILKKNNIRNIDDVVIKFINNIYVQLIDPSITMPLEMAICCLTYFNKTTHFKNSEIIKKITKVLFDFNDKYVFAKNNKINEYFRNIVEDKIPRNIVAKSEFDIRRLNDNTTSTSDYQNYYYELQYNPFKKTHTELRLPEGMGLFIGKQLTKKINNLDEIEDKVITDNNPLNGFTYKECKDWVMIPIINPRTMKPILIDSPIYNRLLCMSYQYDTNLIPRMITSSGYEIIDALTNAIELILANEGKPPQSRDQLEKFIIDKEAQYEKVKGKVKDTLVSSDILGLKWKDVGLRKPADGIDITADNNALVVAITAKVHQVHRAQRSSQDPLAFYAIFTKDEWDKLNITNLTKDSYIKIKRHYYIPVIEKSYSDINKKWISITANNSITKDIKANYMVAKYYTIVDCLRWSQQPNRDPKNPEILIITDSAEYNTIFEQAILYDYDIRPINITPRGKRFLNKILRTRSRFIYSSEFPKCSKRKDGDIEYINSIACKAINNIYKGEDNGKYGEIYKSFREKMVEKCTQYKEPYMSMVALKYSIGMEFNVFPNPTERYSKEYSLNYYQDSALASIVIYYNDLKTQIYNKEYRDIFINDFNKFFVHLYEIDDKLQITKKIAYDAGGVKRDFFTNLYKELFCDEKNLKRPFICPNDNKLNKYYINPNFEPDEKFKKVIAAYKRKEIVRMKKEHAKKEAERMKRGENIIKKARMFILDTDFIESFDRERDYEHIYYIIGKLLCIVVVNEEVGLPKELSTYILAGLINQPKNIDYYDILYFYVREFQQGLTYINMINTEQIKSLNDIGLSYNDVYVISKGADINITTENYIDFLLKLSKHVITKNFIIDGEANMKKRYTSLFAGFSNEIRKFLHKKRATTEQLSSLITNEQLDEPLLQEFASKIKIKIDDPDDDSDKMPSNEQRDREVELKGYISNIITKKRDDETEKDHYDFVRKLLQFWSGYNYYNKNATYIISYKYGVGIDITKLPEAHTCFYTIDVYGFPSELRTPEEREKYIYEKFKWAVEAQEMELF